MRALRSAVVSGCLLTGQAAPGAPAGEPGTPASQSEAPWIEIRLEGLDKALTDETLKALSITRRAGDQRSAAAPVARRLHNHALEQIGLVLQSHGYYRAQVKGELKASGEHWRATYRVDPGAPVLVDRLQVRVTGPGADDDALAVAQREFPLRVGQPLDHDAYERGKSTLLRTARARGYLEGIFTAHVVTVDLNAYRAVVDLQLDTGPRYRFGAVDFHQDVFDDRFLARFASFDEGSYFDTRQVGLLQRRLSDSGLFKDIRVEARTDAPDGLAVPVDVTLNTRARNRYNTGIGYGTDRGVWLRFDYLRRWLNPFGHSLRTDLEWSERTAVADVTYRIPLADPVDEALNAGARYEQEDTDDTSRESTSVLFERVRTRRQHGYSLGVRWLHENYKAGSAAPRESRQLLMPTASWRWTSAPDPVWVARGVSVGGRVTGALEGALSDETLVQVAADAKLVWPLGRDGRVLARANLGITAIDDLDNLPVSLRFFAGGGLSVRGYDYKSLGPLDEYGEVVGGRHLFAASVEYERRLKGELFGAVFFDVGNAFNGSDPDLKRGVGMGLRYALPFGMARLDLATALDRPGTPWHVHFSVGPDL